LQLFHGILLPDAVSVTQELFNKSILWLNNIKQSSISFVLK